MSELNLEYDNTLFLLLNIISHDVIHDYNISSNKSRWENVQTYLDRVTNVEFFGGTLTETRTQTQTPLRKTMSNNSLNINRKTRIFPLINNFFGSTIPGPKLGESPISDQYSKTVLLQFFEYVRSQIILNAFHCIFADPEYLKNVSSVKKIKVDSIFYINYAKDNDVLSLQVSFIEKIVDHFYIYCKYVLKIEHFNDFTHLLNILTQFLHSDIVEKCALKMNKNQSGGVGILPDDNSNCDNLIKEIDGFINLNIDDWTNNFSNNSDIKKIKDYEYLNYRQSLINEVYKIYSKYISNANILNNIKTNLERMIRVKPTKILDRNNLNLNIEIKNAVLYGLTDCYNFLKKENKKEEIIIKKREINQKKLEAGEITNENTSCVNNFMKFIARVGLLVMGICDIEGEFTYFTENKYLIEQCSILHAIAYPSKDNKNKDLDSRLYEFFKKNVSNKIEDNKVNKLILTDKKKCIINNAAPLKESLKNHIFCPYSSIIDGMSNCSFNTATNDYGIESGDMNFNIQHTPSDDTSIFVNYQGFLKIKKNNSINISFAINATNMIISNELDTNLKTGNGLEAYVVLRKSLQVIINKIDFLIIEEGWKPTTEIWTNLFEYGQKQFVYRPKKESYNFFKEILKELLFKGCGDLFQEINAVMKNGGYSNIPKYSKNDIIPFSQTNEIPNRYFFAHDRPSGLRFIFMLQNGNVDEINKNAIGGYYDVNEKLMVEFPNTKTIKSKQNVTSKKRKTPSPSPSPSPSPFSYSYPYFFSENKSNTQLNKTQKTNYNNFQRLQNKSTSGLMRNP